MLTYCLRYELLKYLPSSVHLPEMLRLHNGIFLRLRTLYSRDEHLKPKPCSAQMGGISFWDVSQTL